MTDQTEANDRCVKCGHPRNNHPYRHPFQSLRNPMTDAKDKRIAELEAKLATATDGLRECEGEIDQYIRQEYPGEHPVQERYRQRDFAANPARATLTELQGTTQ